MWIFVIAASVIHLVSYLAALVYVARNGARAPKAAKYLAAAISLLLLSLIGRNVGMMVAARALGAAGIGRLSVWLQAVDAFVWVVALILFISAAFTDRHGRVSQQEFLPGDQTPASTDRNPFVSPSDES